MPQWPQGKITAAAETGNCKKIKSDSRRDSELKVLLFDQLFLEVLLFFF